MDYQRIKRNVTYHSDSCKMYLRHDFKHCCAYCGLPEDIAFEIQQLGETFYEKDHFRPQDLKEPDVHQYFNLFYACKFCNNKKDKLLLPLNPCEDDIYSGEHPHLVRGNQESNYMDVPLTPEGTVYIDKLQLNSRFRIRLRERVIKKIENKQKQTQVYENIRNSGVLTPEQLSDLEMVCQAEQEDPLYMLCGTSPFAMQFIAAYQLLIDKGHPCKILLEEQEIDIAIQVRGNEYFGQMKVHEYPQSCRIKTSVLLNWKTRYDHCCILEYIPDYNQVRMFTIDFGSINWENSTITLKDYQIL